LLISLLALFVALSGVGVAADGQSLILGHTDNSASSPTALTAPVNDKAVQITNTNTGASATALGLTVASGRAPLTVSAGAGKVVNLNADKLDGIDSAGFARAKPLQWIAPTLNGVCGADCVYWQNEGAGWSTAGYTKDSFGIVHLKGVIQELCTCGIAPFILNPVFTLPVGYRPSGESVFATLDGGDALARISVLSDGSVDVAQGSGNVGGYLSLDGITFPAA
jgi:hypothetical protein